MDKPVQGSENSRDSEATIPVVSDAHVGEEFRSSCDGWVRLASQAKCKVLVTLLQGHVPSKDAATTCPPDAAKINHN